ncbi:DUF2793 domain-containing protein [Sinisalibacter lacisalsi]|uniref:DUF2793 domain-containing protein n=1 Tax=Sinisalibacter lacisalsi TaxID=1526570 RepID=A0ABQ1QBU0_9RHOB|nr:DUF2793 domain-containing protein [Sinisalibacter lacisalsi]GGD22218.1 hypothetical protein GCM10011358_03380 [Sinisalibacter lacisalsi]
MSDNSPRLDLPYIQSAQAQKHVTHNEALRVLDALVQLAVVQFDATTPPSLPLEGEVHALGAGAQGDWSGKDGQLAMFVDGAWQFHAPQPGWTAARAGSTELRVWSGSSWEAVVPEAFDNLSGVGVNTTSDGTNRLAVSSPATLLSHEGGGHQLKINKSADTDTASLLFQTNWSARAEMGLAGSDDWSIKVSPDGSTWTEALLLDRATGQASGAAVQASPADARAEKLVRVDGAVTASLASFGADYPAGSGIDIDAVDAGFAGLVSDANPGTWPLAASGALVWLTTQRVHANDAVIQSAHYGYDATAATTMRVFRRLRSGDGNWGPWSEAYTQHSVLGTVGQSGGMPTGAVIERGSNANGDYVRFADGTQWCWNNEFMLGYLNSRVLKGHFTYPAAFAGKPVLTYTPIDDRITPDGNSFGDGTPYADRANVIRGIYPTTAEIRVIDGNDALTSTSKGYVGVMAIGRWF